MQRVVNGNLGDKIKATEIALQPARQTMLMHLLWGVSLGATDRSHNCAGSMIFLLFFF